MFATLARHQYLAARRRGGRRQRLATSARPRCGTRRGAGRQTPVEELRMMPALPPAFRLEDRARGQQVDELMKEHHPEEPHWYLAVIGSDPTVRGGASARR